MHVALEEHRQLARLRFQAGALEREHVVPAVVMKQAGEQGRTENFTHLLAAHPRLQGFDLFARDEIALHHFDAVRADHADDGSAGPVEGAAPCKQGA